MSVYFLSFFLIRFFSAFLIHCLHRLPQTIPGTAFSTLQYLRIWCCVDTSAYRCKPGALMDLFSCEAAAAVVAALFSSLLVSAFPRTDIPLVPSKMALVLGSSACPHSHQCSGSSIPSLRLVEHCGEERQEDLLALCQPIRNKKEKALQSGEGNNRSRHAVCPTPCCPESRERLAPAAAVASQLLLVCCSFCLEKPQ